MVGSIRWVSSVVVVWVGVGIGILALKGLELGLGSENCGMDFPQFMVSLSVVIFHNLFGVLLIASEAFKFSLVAVT